MAGRINISEIVLFNTIKSILAYIREDYDSTTDKTQSFLYNLLGEVKIGELYDCYEQGKAMFIQKNDNPRYLDVRLFFDASRASIPTIHITLPNETGSGDGIGVDIGYEEAEFDDVRGEYREVNNRMFNATYNVIITSDNTMEVVIMYHVLRASLIAAFAHMELSGLRNPKLSGGDLSINPDLVPIGIFMRSIAINASYEISVPELFAQKMAKKILLINDDKLISNIEVDLTSADS